MRQLKIMAILTHPSGGRAYLWHIGNYQYSFGTASKTYATFDSMNDALGTLTAKGWMVVKS